MKAKYILHIPTGLYYNYAYWPDTYYVCCVILTKEPSSSWHNFTSHFEALKQAKSVFIHDEQDHKYEVSSNEFELIELECRDKNEKQ
jgi:hypothetical protein